MLAAPTDLSFIAESLHFLYESMTNWNGLKTTKSALACRLTWGVCLHCLPSYVDSPTTAVESQLFFLILVHCATPLSWLRTKRLRIWQGQRTWRWSRMFSKSWARGSPQRGIALKKPSRFHLLTTLLLLHLSLLPDSLLSPTIFLYTSQWISNLITCEEEPSLSSESIHN
jgi:hypothetical protein